MGTEPDFREPASFTDPPFEPDCQMCDGTRKVTVSGFLDVDGKPHDWPGGSDDVTGPEVDCPWCAE